jgi:hypothetical protein
LKSRQEQYRRMQLKGQSQCVGARAIVRAVVVMGLMAASRRPTGLTRWDRAAVGARDIGVLRLGQETDQVGAVAWLPAGSSSMRNGGGWAGWAGAGAPGAGAGGKPKRPPRQAAGARRAQRGDEREHRAAGAVRLRAHGVRGPAGRAGRVGRRRCGRRRPGGAAAAEVCAGSGDALSSATDFKSERRAGAGRLGRRPVRQPQRLALDGRGQRKGHRPR